MHPIFFSEICHQSPLYYIYLQPYQDEAPQGSQQY